MNKQFDVLIIGDSPEGAYALKAIASASRKIKIAYISREFKSATTRDFLNVEYIKEEVMWLDYKVKLFGCYLKNGDRLYSTHVIIASGLRYTPYCVNGKPVPNVYNNHYDISKFAKSLPAVVVGRDTQSVKLAIAVAKKYRQVYLCIDSLTVDCSKALQDKLNCTKNIVMLPNATISKVHSSKNELISVEFSNYSQVTCKAIFIKTACTPETEFIPENIIQKNEEGYCITTKAAQSVLVPNFFVVGSAALKSTKKQRDTMITEILQEFMEK